MQGQANLGILLSVSFLHFFNQQQRSSSLRDVIYSDTSYINSTAISQRFIHSRLNTAHYLSRDSCVIAMRFHRRDDIAQCRSPEKIILSRLRHKLCLVSQCLMIVGHLTQASVSELLSGISAMCTCWLIPHTSMYTSILANHHNNYYFHSDLHIL